MSRAEDAMILPGACHATLTLSALAACSSELFWHMLGEQKHFKGVVNDIAATGSVAIIPNLIAEKETLISMVLKEAVIRASNVDAHTNDYELRMISDSV